MGNTSIRPWFDKLTTSRSGQVRKALVVSGIIFCLFSSAFVMPAFAAGEIIAWGQNDYGQCGVPLPNMDFTAVAGGASHSLGLKADGSIVAWGNNTYGQCNILLPNAGVADIAAGSFHSLGLKTDGSIVAWGRNNYGQCDVPSPNANFVAIAGSFHSLALKADSSIIAWGHNTYGQCNVPLPNTGFAAIAAGALHSLGLKTDGSIIAWGRNNYGQCDVPLPNADFVAIAAGYYHSLGLKADGSIVAWGDNYCGQCDIPLPNTGFAAIAGGEEHSLGLKTDGSIVAWGDNYFGQCVVPPPNMNFTAISAGGYHSLGLISFEYSGGTGEPNDPYQIAKADDLLELAVYPYHYNKCFVLTDDIDLAGQVFTTAIIAPDISSGGGFDGVAFTGTFDGNGCKITNFTINGGNNDYIGLFGYIRSGASVKNLGLEDFSVNGYQYVGGLVGYSYYGSISNCYAAGIVSGSSYVGGLVGYSYYGSIDVCYATGAVGGYDNVGGLVGYGYYGSIDNCYATGEVSGRNYVGGLVGSSAGSVSNCYATGTISGENYVGGLVGNSANIISNCYATGAVNGNGNVGGLVGRNASGVTNCYSIGAVSGSSNYVGGLVGCGGNISNCYSTGTVSSSSNYVGGLVGYGSNISNCYSTGAISGYQYVGGLVGCGGSISNCYSAGAVVSDSQYSKYVGGLVGYISGGSINNSFWDRDTSGRWDSAGGTGKTTVQMQDISTFLNAGWDFLGETANGTDDIWQMLPGAADYPKFAEQSSIPIAYSGGTGEPNDPYQIGTVLDWWQLMGAPADWGKHFILVNDLSLQGLAITPVGIGIDNYRKSFTGVFDGNGYIICNVNINLSGSDYVGLFGRVGTGGQIRNLGAENVGIKGDKYVGGLVGVNDGGNISNCYVIGDVNTVNSSYACVGGLVSVNGGAITDCYAAGTVSGKYCEGVGGLAGSNSSKGSISNCYSTGKASGNWYVGGLVGRGNGSISNCYSMGTVSGHERVGGLVGYSYYGSISNCYSTGAVSGSQYSVGGLVGYNSGGSISDCYSTGKVSGNWYVGGLVGRSYGGSISNSFWDIETSGQTTSAGGEGKTTAQMQDISTFLSAGWDFIGETANGTYDIWLMLPDAADYPKLSWQSAVYSGGTGEPNDPYQIADANDLLQLAVYLNHYDKCFILTDDINLAGQVFTGAIIAADISPNEDFQGIAFTGTFDGNGHKITNFATNSVSVNNWFIGLFGKIDSGGTVKNLGLENFSVSGDEYVGGLVGFNYGGSISTCYSTGAVSGFSYVGGLAGDNYGGISNCYSTSTVSGFYCVGGLVGINGCDYNNYYNSNYYGSISNCYATGAVSSSDNWYTGGGLVGDCSNKSIINNSFWDIETSGWTTSAGGTGKTTAQMQNINTFLNAGWDFVRETANGTEDIWTICQGITYPKFVYQNAKPIADAGPSQTVYAWLDGIAEVELDGSASSDEDECNGLIFHWTWAIDDNTYEANGVNPIIELPVGVHTIELIVNDGLADSEPNYVDVNVIAPLETDLQIMPRVVNRASKNRNIIAVMDMPKGIKRGDISKEPFVLYPANGEEGIEAVRQYVLPCGRQRVRVFVLFDKDDLIDLIPNNGRVKLQVVGELTTGQCIFGEDDIWLIGKRRPFWWWRKW